MRAHALHFSILSTLWALMSLGFCAFSFAARHIFWRGVKRAALLPPGRTRDYALHEAWDEVHDEEWRLSKHIMSVLLGVTAQFVTPIPGHFVPTDAKYFDAFVILVLFYLNFATGMNTLRTIIDWRWKERFVGNTPYPMWRFRYWRRAARGREAKERQRREDEHREANL